MAVVRKALSVVTVVLVVAAATSSLAGRTDKPVDGRAAVRKFIAGKLSGSKDWGAKDENPSPPAKDLKDQSSEEQQPEQEDFEKSEIDSRQPDTRKQDSRQTDLRKQDSRQQDSRQPDSRLQDSRQAESRQPDSRKESKNSYGGEYGAQYYRGYNAYNPYSGNGESHARRYGQYYDGSSSVNFNKSCEQNTTTWVRDPQMCNKGWMCKNVKGKYEYKYEMCPPGEIFPEGKQSEFECVAGNPDDCNKEARTTPAPSRTSQEENSEIVSTTYEPEAEFEEITTRVPEVVEEENEDEVG